MTKTKTKSLMEVRNDTVIECKKNDVHVTSMIANDCPDLMIFKFTNHGNGNADSRFAIWPRVIDYKS